MRDLIKNLLRYTCRVCDHPRSEHTSLPRRVEGNCVGNGRFSGTCDCVEFVPWSNSFRRAPRRFRDAL